jgi:transposase
LLKFEHAPRHAAFLDYCAEVEHHAARVERLEGEIDRAIEQTSPKLKTLYQALQALRGVAKVTAATIVTELGDLSRFERAQDLMGYAGVIPSEHTSGGTERRGRITKTGNAHLRRVIVEAAWSYRHQPWLGGTLRRRGAAQPETIRAISWKAQQRLHRRYVTLVARGKPEQKAITAVAREFLGFIWAVGRVLDQKQPTTLAA